MSCVRQKSFIPCLFFLCREVNLFTPFLCIKYKFSDSPVRCVFCDARAATAGQPTGRYAVPARHVVTVGYSRDAL